MADRIPHNVTIGDVEYQVCGLAPRPIFHISRRLGPFFASLAPFLMTLNSFEKAGVQKAADGSSSDELTGEDTAGDPDAIAEAEAGAEPDKAAAKKEAMEKAAIAFEALSTTLANMTDAQADYVLDGLLRGVRVVLSQGRGVAPMFQGERMMYPNTPIEAQVELAGRVLWFNLESFFDGLPSAFKEQIRKAATLSIG
jgi:hypothetical protein